MCLSTCVAHSFKDPPCFKKQFVDNTIEESSKLFQIWTIRTNGYTKTGAENVRLLPYYIWYDGWDIYKDVLHGSVLTNKLILAMCLTSSQLTHWGRATHLCVGKLTIIGADNGLSPGRRQAIIWTNGIFLIGPLRTNVSEILIEIYIFSFKKMHLKLSSVKRRPFCLGLNVLTNPPQWRINTPVIPRYRVKAF